MQNFRVIGQVVQLYSGNVKLNKAQAAARAGFLGEGGGRGGRIYPILKPVQFKRGEIFGFDGAIPKDQADEVEVDSDGKVIEPSMPAEKPQDPAVVMAAIVAALAKLVTPEDFADGVAKPEAVARETGWEVSVEEIEAALVASA